MPQHIAGAKLAKKWHKLINALFKMSNKCCDYIKKWPLHKYSKDNNAYPFIGTTVADSMQRMMAYSKNGGCNLLNGKHPMSMPMSLWNRTLIEEYIKRFNLPVCSIYQHVTHTGCMFCMFGVHMEKQPNRFQSMSKTHPELWNYCINKLGCGKVMDFIGVPYK